MNSNHHQPVTHHFTIKAFSTASGAITFDISPQLGCSIPYWNNLRFKHLLCALVLLGLKPFRLNPSGFLLWLKGCLLAWISSARLWRIHNTQNNCITSADISQKILWNKVTPLQSPHMPIFITHVYNTDYRTILRYLMQTHVFDSCCYITITHGLCFEGATNPRDKELYSQLYINIPTPCWLMKQCCTATIY